MALNVLRCYSFYEASDTYGSVEQVVKEEQARFRAAGIEYDIFCLTLDPPGACLTFRELDKRWKRGDRKLLRMYEDLERALEGKDVLMNESGINLHPEFVAKLPVFTVFQCMDDPENSDNLTRPAVAAYDMAFSGNVAEIGNYRKWGAKNVEWGPLGFRLDQCDQSLTFESILEGRPERDIGLFMMIDRMSPWRKPRMDRMLEAFPDGHFYGNGWPRGFLPVDAGNAFLSRAKIGPNFHNSTGPINYRTFYLPANGVMQICDNKSHLGKVYELGKEVVGFETVDECVEACRYYLAHDRERREIAANGWKRAVSDYNEKAVYLRKLEQIGSAMAASAARRGAQGLSGAQRRATMAKRAAHDALAPVRFPIRAVKWAGREFGLSPLIKKFMKRS